MTIDPKQFAWEKMQGLLPVIVQHAVTNAVLMLGYMNQEALQATLDSKDVIFFSRSKNRLWKKGETSGHTLEWVDIVADCDQDALLIRANPQGPTCHQGTATCFPLGKNEFSIEMLEETILNRSTTLSDTSYTSQLFQSGINRIAQKVGEEGVEVALAAVSQSNDILCEEIADLIFHILVLLRAKHLTWSNVLGILKSRKK